MHASGRRTAFSVLAILALAQLSVLMTVAPQAAAAGIPVIERAYYGDLDGNGYLDVVWVETSQDVDPSTLFADQYTLSCSSGVAGCGSTFSLEPYSIGPTAAGFYLLIREDIRLGTGVILDFTYNADAGTLTNVPESGDPVAFESVDSSDLEPIADDECLDAIDPDDPLIGECDLAAPVLRGITVTPGTNDAIASFSEPIRFAAQDADSTPSSATLDERAVTAGRTAHNEAIFTYDDGTCDAGTVSALRDDDENVQGTLVAGSTNMMGDNTPNYNGVTTATFEDLAVLTGSGDYSYGVAFELGDGDGIGPFTASTGWTGPPPQDNATASSVEGFGDIIVPGTPDSACDFIALDAGSVQDVHGLTNFFDDERALDRFRVLSVDGGQGANIVLATFSGAIENGAGKAVGTGQFQFRPEQDASGTGSANTLTGVVGALGSHQAILLVSPKLNAVDLDYDDDPETDGAKMQVSSSGSIRQAGGLALAQTDKVIAEQDTSFPQALEIKSLDLDTDGELDTVQITFDEGIDDDSVEGSAGDWTLSRVAPLGDDTLLDDTSYRIGTDATDCPGFTNFPASQANDNLLFICGLESATLDGADSSDPPLFLGTGARLVISYEAPSSDAIVNLRPDTGSQDAIPIDDIFDYMALDAARPILVGAYTRDSDISGPNGKLNGYRMYFSEDIRDSLLPPTDWTASGRTTRFLQTFLPTSELERPLDFQVPSPCLERQVNDPCITLEFQESTSYDTDKKPDLTSSASPLVTDIAGNKVLPVLAASVVEKDDAQPLMVRVEATVGQSQATVYFSEPVQRMGSTGGILDYSAFVYNPVNAEGAASIIQASHGTPDKSVVRLTLNAPLTNADFTQETIAVALNAVQELVTTQATYDPPGPDTSAQYDNTCTSTEPGPYPATTGEGTHGYCVPAALRAFQVTGASDTSAPNQILTLKARAGAKTLILNWTAPGDDGATGTVTGYQVRVSTDPITETNFATIDPPAANEIEFSPATLLGAGGLQTVKIRGLEANTPYYVAVKAYDDTPNTGSLSNVVAVTTEDADGENPGPVTALAATNPGANSVTLSWTAPSEDGASGTDPVDRYIIKYAEEVIKDDTPTNKVSTASVTTFTPFPLAGKGAQQTVLVAGLLPGKTYYFQVIAVDDGDLESDPVSTTVGITTAAGPDQIAPGVVTALVASAPTTNSVKLTWTAPGDDGNSGTVTSYDVKASLSTITEATFASAPSGPTVTLDPVIVVANGATQTATVSGLQPGTAYFFAVKARDENNNLGPISTVVTATTTADTTGPVGTLAVTCGAVDTVNQRVTCSWSGLTDAESTLRFLYILDEAEGTTVTEALAETTTATSLPIDLTEDGTFFLHVAGISAGGQSATETVQIDVSGLGAGTVDVSDANQDLAETVSVVRVGDRARVSWTIPTTAGLDGFQVWCGDGTAFTLVEEDVPATSSSATVPSCKGGQYVVTAFYADGSGLSAQGEPDDIPGFADIEPTALAAEKDTGFPWKWVVLGLAVVVVAGLVVLVLVMVRRRNGAQAVEEGEAPWPGEEGAEAAPAAAEQPWPEEEGGIDAAEPAAAAAPPPPQPLQTHNVTCPKCKTPFTAQGQKPLQIECPNCHVKGMLR